MFFLTYCLQLGLTQLPENLTVTIPNISEGNYTLKLKINFLFL